MQIIAITLKNFKSFEESQTFTFEQLNLIKGINGCGKTTLANESILFVLYGNTPKDSLQKLPTRWSKSKTCLVSIEIIQHGNTYIIKREYPTKVTIFENEIEISTEWTNAEAQKWLINKFGTLQYFRQFRTIESHSKDNVLEQGPSALKKILFSISESIFNDVKTKLQSIKRNRELYNKDNAVMYPYYPSERRLETLELEMLGLDSKITDMNNEIQVASRRINTLESSVSANRNSMRILEQNKSKLNQNSVCYACNRGLEEEKRKSMINEIDQKIAKVNEVLIPQDQERQELRKSWDSSQVPLTKLRNRKNRAKELWLKLDNRIKLKNYKYTNKDVLIVKKAIEELEHMSTYYLTESVKVLEPIINSILSKIDFRVKFEVSDKNKFTITLEKEGVEYTYSDLSEGQKLLVQIGFKLALLMERNESGIIVADEGFSSLDEENLKHIINIFQNTPFQLFLVLHHAPQLPENIKVINLNKGE